VGAVAGGPFARAASALVAAWRAGGRQGAAVPGEGGVLRCFNRLGAQVLASRQESGYSFR